MNATNKQAIMTNPYDSLNDAQLKVYCNSKRELSNACVAYAQFKQLYLGERASLEGEKALKAQRKEAKKLAEIIHSIGKEMFEDEAAKMLQQNEK
jgi:hypothetical protein